MRAPVNRGRLVKFPAGGVAGEGHALEAMEARKLLAADLAVQFDEFANVPAVMVPGDRVALPILVDNIGDQTAMGRVTINFYLSKDTNFDADDILLRSFANEPLELPAGTGGDFTGTVTIPTIAPGDYFFVVRILPNSAIGDTNQSNNVAASDNDQTFDWKFGNFNGRTNVSTTITTPDGVAVTFSLQGSGSGEVKQDGGNSDRLDIELEDTGAATNVTVAASGGNGPNAGVALIDDVMVSGSIGTFSATSGRLMGDFTVAGTAGAIRFAQVEGPSLIDINTGGVNTSFELGTVRNLTITTAAGITSLAVTSWVDNDGTPDLVEGRWIGALTSGGAFQPSLELSGRNGRTLDTVNISGTASKGAWDINGRAGNWRFRATAADWSASIKNNIVSFTVNKSFRGVIAAKAFSTIELGIFAGGRILAGADLGEDARRGGTGADADTYGGGTINMLRIFGRVSNAIVGAGLDPVDDVFKNGNDVLRGGRINNIIIRRQIPNGNRFLAGRFTPTGTFTIAGNPVNTATDPRFQLS